MKKRGYFNSHTYFIRFIYKLILFKLNQMLKNIEMPDRLKRAARSLPEIRQFSMTVQAALNAGKDRFLTYFTV